MDPPTAALDSAATHLALSRDKATSGVHEPLNGVGPPSIIRKPLDLRCSGLDDSLTTSYPTRSLEFLRRLKGEGQAQQGGKSTPVQARVRLNIVIVGAGLGGLATAVALARSGHSVEVLEQAPALGEVGAGIQIPPNSAKLLRRWGVLKYLEQSAVQPDSIKFRRWADGDVIGLTALNFDFATNFGSPYYVVHRADFHKALYRRAKELGVGVRLNSRIVEYVVGGSSAVLENGSVVGGDLIIGADGIKSLARQVVQPGVDCGAKITGFAAYRATVDVEKMAADPDVAWLLEKPSLNIWIGENRHVMTYTIASGKSFNMVLSHRDHSDTATWRNNTALEDMRMEFSGWDPRLTKIIAMIDSCLKWPLMSGSELKTWVAPSQKLAIMGDAAHAMVPYMSQGAAMAVEDGAVLAVVLSRISSVEELPFALRVYEAERIERAGDMQRASMVNGLIWHFADGPEQEARDASMRADVEGRAFSWSANQWSDPVTQWWAYGYDAETAAGQRWDSQVSKLIRGSCDRQ